MNHMLHLAWAPEDELRHQECVRRAAAREQKRCHESHRRRRKEIIGALWSRYYGWVIAALGILWCALCVLVTS